MIIGCPQSAKRHKHAFETQHLKCKPILAHHACVSFSRTAAFYRVTVVTWCLRTYIGLRPYMVNVYIKERINDQKTICTGGVTSNTTYLGGWHIMHHRSSHVFWLIVVQRFARLHLRSNWVSWMLVILSHFFTLSRAILPKLRLGVCQMNSE